MDPKLEVAETFATDRNDLATAPTVAPRTPSAIDGEPAPVRGSLSRYRLDAMLGVGGMGEVVSAQDEQIGRPVAIKRMRTDAPTPEAVTRFLREARIQGRLEHPAIVPVHELQHDEHGNPFFVMKQLTGTTLAASLEKADAPEPRLKLLRAFVDVCLAIEFAHTHGVVHRDLKPSNIMLGDFGEVYVLDWGIARVVGDTPTRAMFSDVDSLEVGGTSVGTVLGTPGYMAPEQLQGETDLDGRADVYALGSILFELLARKPLHPRGAAALRTTLVEVDARPSLHDPDVPPELDAICVAATQLDRGGRYGTARALGDAVQRFLDGDRDVALRKQLAQAEVETARTALVAGDGPRERETAMRAAARALALDPTNREPADLVGRLMLEPPRDTPPEVELRMVQDELDALNDARPIVRGAAISILALAPLLWRIGGHAWCVVPLAIVGASIALATYLVPRSRGILLERFLLVGWALIISAFSVMSSPFLLVPGAVVLIAMGLAMYRTVARTSVIVAVLAFAALSPWLLSFIDVLPRDVAIVGKTIVLTVATDPVEPLAVSVMLGIFLVAMTGSAAMIARAATDSRTKAQRQLAIQAWQLRQLVPSHEEL